MTEPTPPNPPSRWNAFAWVLIVVGIGIVLGLLLGFLSPPPPGPSGPPGAPPPRPLGALGGIASAIVLALSIALIVVYVRTYLDTRARFALGLVVVLGALAVQTLAGSSLVLTAFGFGPGGLWPFLTLGYVCESVALSVFLFLSLE